MNNNKVAAAMAQIENAGRSRRFLVVLKDCTSTLEKILYCLKDNGYIKDVLKCKQGNKYGLIVALKYYSQKPNAKTYIKEPVIEEFYNTHKDVMFNTHDNIKINRASTEFKPVIKKIINKSKGSGVVYCSYKDLLKHRDQFNSFGILILTTDKGVMSHVNAIEEKLGGKLLIGVY